jgi:tRNA threonylcarbamoyladenosine biosynthesis protein TsaB
MPSNCFGLALHSTTEVLEIAIAQVTPKSLLDRSLDLVDLDVICDRSWHFRSWHLGRELSSQIHNCLAEMLAEPELGFGWNDLAWLAVAKGIGSFTSTRVGMVLIRTLAQQLELPVYAIDCETISLNAQNLSLPLGISLLNLANQQWQSQEFPDWGEALPLYGGEFGT